MLRSAPVPDLFALTNHDDAIVRLDRSVSGFVDSASDHVPLVLRIVYREAPVDVMDDGKDDFLTVATPEGSCKASLNFD